MKAIPRFNLKKKNVDNFFGFFLLFLGKRRIFNGFLE